MEKKTKIPHVPFYFIRHGQTDWNTEHRVMGQTDIPLNEVGIQQAHAVAQSIAHLEVSKIFASPLQRARQTAEIIGAKLNSTITHLDELKECYVGSMEGQCKGEWFIHWEKGGDIEDAESWLDFERRIATGLTIALENNASEKPILIVAHGGVYRVLLRIFNIQDAAKRAENCGVYFFSPPELDANWRIVNALFEQD